MSLFNYFHAAVQNDNPFGLSSKSVPAKTLVEVSKQVKAAQEKRRKRGPYTRNSEEDKLLIGRHASEMGLLQLSDFLTRKILRRVVFGIGKLYTKSS